MTTSFNAEDMASFGGFIAEWQKKGMLEIDSNEKYFFHISNLIDEVKEGNLVNMTNGGEGTIGRIFSKEHRDKIGKAHKGKQWALGRHHSNETKEKISNSNKGKHDYLKGLTHSDETKQKMSISKIGNKINVGRKHSEETKQKIKEKRKLQVFSDESKQKMKESRLNYINKTK